MVMCRTNLVVGAPEKTLTLAAGHYQRRQPCDRERVGNARLSLASRTYCSRWPQALARQGAFEKALQLKHQPLWMRSKDCSCRTSNCRGGIILRQRTEITPLTKPQCRGFVTDLDNFRTALQRHDGESYSFEVRGSLNGVTGDLRST